MRPTKPIGPAWRPVHAHELRKIAGLERVMHFIMPRDGTESAQMQGAVARAGLNNPSSHGDAARWADSVPPEGWAGKGPPDFVVGPQSIVLLIRFGPPPRIRAFSGPSRGCESA